MSHLTNPDRVPRYRDEPAIRTASRAAKLPSREAALGWLLRRQEGSPSAEERAGSRRGAMPIRAIVRPMPRPPRCGATPVPWSRRSHRWRARAPRQTGSRQAEQLIQSRPLRDREAPLADFAAASSLVAVACLLAFFVAAPSLSHLPGRLLAITARSPASRAASSCRMVRSPC